MHYQVVVLGSGPAGYNAALATAKEGLSTAIIENDAPGGTGFRWGCLPVKGGLDLLRHPGTDSPKAAFSKRMARAVETSEEIRRRLSQKGVDLILAEPCFIENNRIELATVSDSQAVSAEFVTADRIIVATGTNPASPPGISFDTPGVISHKELLFLPEIPESLIFLGGNVEAIELAQLYSRLGTEVTIVEMENEILTGNERELTSPIEHALVSAGVKIFVGTKVESVESAKKPGDQLNVFTSAGTTPLKGQYLVVTGFRTPSIPRGWEAIGGVVNKSGIPVNDKFETNISGVFAVGDVNGLHGMAHVAIHQALGLPRVWKGESLRQEYPLLPRSIFTVPEITGAGVQQGDMTPLGNPYTVVKAELKNSWRGFLREEEGFIKLLFDEDERLRGIWAVGRDITEMMTFSGVLLKSSPTRAELRDSLYINPTLGEAIVDVL